MGWSRGWTYNFCLFPKRKQPFLMRFLYVPDSFPCSLHLSSVACRPQLFVAQQSLCVVSIGFHTIQLQLCSTLTNKTATAVLAQGSSLCVIKTHHSFQIFVFFSKKMFVFCIFHIYLFPFFSSRCQLTPAVIFSSFLFFSRPSRRQNQTVFPFFVVTCP